jgi:hypothetical protein
MNEKKIMNKLRNEKLNYFDLKKIKQFIINYIEFRANAATQGHLMTHELQMQRNNIDKLTQTELIKFVNNLYTVGIKLF